MSTHTSDDIERLLALVEGRQVKCGNCGSSDGDLLIPYYDVTSAVFPLTGGAITGESFDTTSIEGAPMVLACHICQTRTPLPADFKCTWTNGESTLCDCGRAKQLEKVRLRKEFSLSGEARCDHCKVQVFWVVDGTNNDGIEYGNWYHADTRGLPGERACAKKAKGANGTEYTAYAAVRAV